MSVGSLIEIPDFIIAVKKCASIRWKRTFNIN